MNLLRSLKRLKNRIAPSAEYRKIQAEIDRFQAQLISGEDERLPFLVQYDIQRKQQELNYA